VYVPLVCILLSFEVIDSVKRGAVCPNAKHVLVQLLLRELVGEAEVRYNQPEVFVNKKVLRFNVSVHNSSLVKVLDPLDKLQVERAGKSLGESFSPLYKVEYFSILC
jgi:hypothetical protein